MVFLYSMGDCRLIHRITCGSKEQGRWLTDPPCRLAGARSKADGRSKQH